MDGKLRVVFTVKVGGAVAYWLERWTLDRRVRVPAMAGVIVLCSWHGQDTLLSRRLSPLRSINGYRRIVGAA